MIPENSILCTCIASIGKNAFLPVKCAFNQQINALSPYKNNYPYFLFADSYHWSITMKNNAGGLTFQIVNKSEFSNIKTCVPKYEEQEKIGNLFYKLDNLITLHQCEQNALYWIQNCTFTFFSISWEQRKLGESGTTFTGLSGKSKEDFGHGTANFVTYMNVYLNPIADKSRIEKIEIDNSQNTVRYGDIFFTTSSETPEEVGMSSIWLENMDNIYLNSFCFGFRSNLKFNPYYMAYQLRSPLIRKKIILLAQGISRYNISKNKLLEISISLPKYEEQEKIGNLFYKLDNLITLHQCEQIIIFSKVLTMIS